MTKEEARNVFGGSIVNNLLSLGAEPTNVVRQDGLIEWKSDGYIEVGGVQVWAYYYFEDGEDVDRCDWEDHMEIEIGMLDLKPIDGSGITPRGTGGCVTAWQATGVYRRSFWRGNIKY